MALLGLDSKFKRTQQSFNTPVYFNMHACESRYNLIYYYQHLKSVCNYMFLSTKKTKKIKFSNKNILSTKRRANMDISDKFLNFFLRRGLKIQYLKSLNLGISGFYFFYFFFNKFLSKQHMDYSSVFNLIPNFIGFYYFPKMLNFFSNLLEPFFYLKVKRVEKKYRKKLKKKFVSETVYIKPQKRIGLVLRSLLYYTNIFSHNSVSERLSWALFKTLTEQKNSYLYKRKIYMYTKMFKKFQKKVF